MLYFLGLAGVAIIVVGTWYSVEIMRRQQYRERDLSEPPRGAAERPMIRNPIFVMYIVIPVLAMILGIVAWLVFE